VYLSLYVLVKGKKFLYRFLATFIINISLMTVIMVIGLRQPHHVQKINIGFLVWLITGVIFLILFIIKVVIFRKVYRRSKDPGYFHYNYFGRKVYNGGVIKKSEFFIVIGQMPFFLFMGGYFIGKLINIILHGCTF
jgi:hypothetical protein